MAQQPEGSLQPVFSGLDAAITTIGPNQVGATIPTRYRTLTILKDVSYAQPGSRRIIQRADSSGLTTTTLASNGTDLEPPPLSKEVIEWLSRERLLESDSSIELQRELQTKRVDMMMQRQVGAARQMRLANRLSGLLARQMANNELDEERIEVDLRRHDHLRRQMKPRQRLLWQRFNDIQQAVSLIR